MTSSTIRLDGARLSAILLGVVAMIASCDRPTDVKMPGDTMHAVGERAQCGRSCVLAADLRPFSAATARRDTFGLSTPVASLEIDGAAGAEVSLRLARNIAFSGQLELRQIVVTVDGIAREVSYGEALTGVRIHRFVTDGRVKVQYELRQVVGGPIPRGTAQLVQELSGNASIVRSVRHWIRDVSLARLLDADRCVLEEPGPYCGFQIDVLPYIPVDGALGTFQNVQFYHGQSYPIRINFTEPVKDLVVTIADPDFAGNTATVTTSSGAVSREFAYDGTPGVYSESQLYFPEEGITSLDLVPPTGDWVYYFGISFVGKDHINISCQGGGERVTDSIACTGVSSNASLSVQVTEWRFNGKKPHEYFQVTEAAQANTWAGRTAADGDIVAVGMLSNGASATGARKVGGGRRYAWNFMVPSVTLREDSAFDLPAHPTRVGELGHIHYFYKQLIYDPGYHDSLPPGGPASDARFFTLIPVSSELVIHINRLALSVGSDFWAKQAKKRVQGYCGRDDVVPFIPVVEQHEGTRWDAGSHSYRYRQYMNDNAGIRMEDVVARENAYFRWVADSVGTEVYAKADTAGALADSYPPQYCTFKYF